MSAKPPKLIAFYLPQFHPIPENDEWWGTGFTEWTNVTKATPLFPDHYQPRLPADLGFYDLRIPEIRKQQAELAASYGIFGFCYYYYWFSGKKILDRPLTEVLHTRQPNFPFCVCWANENWTRRWDGAENDILLEQKYDRDDPPKLISDLAPLFRDDRYITIDGKPLLLVYRPSVIPDATTVIRVWRQEAKRLGFAGLHICGVLTFEQRDPRADGFDSAVEFPPHGIKATELPPASVGCPTDFRGKIYDYNEVVINELRKPKYTFKTFRTAMPSWDNSARTGMRAHIFTKPDPAVFGMWLEYLIKEAQQDDSELVFINAWNEWAEGTHLEPDRAFGYAWLEAVRDAIDGRLYPESTIRLLTEYLSDAPEFIQDKLYRLGSALANYQRSVKTATTIFRDTVSYVERFSPIHFSDELPATIASLPIFPAAKNHFDSVTDAEIFLAANHTQFLSGWLVADGLHVGATTPIVIILQHTLTKQNYYGISNSRKERADVYEALSTTHGATESRYSGFEFSLSSTGIPNGRYTLAVGAITPTAVLLGMNVVHMIAGHRPC